MDQNCTVWEEIFQIKYTKRKRGNNNTIIARHNFLGHSQIFLEFTLLVTWYEY
jgi:hypothetical protein